MERQYAKSFVLYESVYIQYKRLQRLSEEIANKFLIAVIEYGLNNIKPKEDDDVWLYGLDGIIASIDSAKRNRGKRIDIPRDELQYYLSIGKTQKEIAQIYSCSDDTIKRRIDEYNL